MLPLCAISDEAGEEMLGKDPDFVAEIVDPLPNLSNMT